MKNIPILKSFVEKLQNIPANVMTTSQFSVGTVLIQDLCDVMYLPAWRRRFPKSLSVETKNAVNDYY